MNKIFNLIICLSILTLTTTVSANDYVWVKGTIKDGVCVEYMYRLFHSPSASDSDSGKFLNGCSNPKFEILDKKYHEPCKYCDQDAKGTWYKIRMVEEYNAGDFLGTRNFSGWVREENLIFNEKEVQKLDPKKIEVKIDDFGFSGYLGPDIAKEFDGGLTFELDGHPYYISDCEHEDLDPLYEGPDYYWNAHCNSNLPRSLRLGNTIDKHGYFNVSSGEKFSQGKHTLKIIHKGVVLKTVYGIVNPMTKEEMEEYKRFQKSFHLTKTYNR